MRKLCDGKYCLEGGAKHARLNAIDVLFVEIRYQISISIYRGKLFASEL